MEELKKKIQNIKKEQVIIFAVGLLIGLLTMIVFYPDRIAELKNGEQVAIKVGDTDITADKIYEELKKEHSLNTIVELIDRTILESKYTLTDEDYAQIDTTAQNYINTYETYYQMTEEEFLERNGFKSLDEFKTSLELDYMRSNFYKEYLKNTITDEELNSFYNDKTFGTIRTEHILVKIENMSDEDAKAKSEEILNKLKNGSSWDDVKNEYMSVITTESVPVDFDSNLESAYKTEAINLSDGGFSSSPVKTSYGYHIVYRISTDEKPDLNTFKSRIQSMIVTEKDEADSKLYEKVLIKMREEASTEIKDTELLKTYNEYVSSVE